MRNLAILATAIVIFGCPGQGAMAESLLSTELRQQMSNFDVIILGETHDNPQHHLVQAEAVEAIAPTAVVWEMVTEEGAQRLAQKAASNPQELSEILRWAELGWPPLSMYYPIFGASEAPVYGAMVPRSAARLAMERGAATALGADAARYGLTVPLPAAEQAAREADQLAAHCDAVPAEILPQLVAIQRLRDAVLARATLQAVDDTGGPVVVITGNGHARRDWGIPTFLSRLRPGLKVFALGQSEGGEIAGEFDAVVESPPVDREDPCKAFQVQD